MIEFYKCFQSREGGKSSKKKKKNEKNNSFYVNDDMRAHQRKWKRKTCFLHRRRLIYFDRLYCLNHHRDDGCFESFNGGCPATDNFFSFFSLSFSNFNACEFFFLLCIEQQVCVWFKFFFSSFFTLYPGWSIFDCWVQERTFFVFHFSCLSMMMMIIMMVIQSPKV